MAYRERVDCLSTFEVALDQFSGKMDFSWVKSCVAICSGHGKEELLFARRILTKLERFIAVDRDHESLEAFRANIQAGSVCFVTFL